VENSERPATRPLYLGRKHHVYPQADHDGTIHVTLPRPDSPTAVTTPPADHPATTADEPSHPHDYEVSLEY
jgi:hypothetical protein